MTIQIQIAHQSELGFRGNQRSFRRDPLFHEGRLRPEVLHSVHLMPLTHFRLRSVLRHLTYLIPFPLLNVLNVLARSTPSIPYHPQSLHLTNLLVALFRQERLTSSTPFHPPLRLPSHNHPYAHHLNQSPLPLRLQCLTTYLCCRMLSSISTACRPLRSHQSAQSPHGLHPSTSSATYLQVGCRHSFHPPPSHHHRCDACCGSRYINLINKDNIALVKCNNSPSNEIQFLVMPGLKSN